MRAFKDDRNRAYNDVFPAIGVGDINVSVLYPGTIKAFHRHKKQDDYWFVAKGNLRVVLAEETPPFWDAHIDWVCTFYKNPNKGINVVMPESKQIDDYRDKPEYKIEMFVRDGMHFERVLKASKSSLKVTVKYLSEGDILQIPAGVWHGLQVLGNEEAIMIYHITQKYDETNPDEERESWNKFHSWEISRK